ncbi:MAG: DegT/DnrJ/EryC1/StrS family aminotransferase [Nitrospirales bacterium]
MKNNIVRADLDSLCEYLQQDDPMLTQAKQVESFEQEWSNWLGVRFSVFVNSGSSANLVTLAALRDRVGTGEIIVPTLTWVSDITSVIQNGFQPVFVDIDSSTLGMNTDQVIAKITPNTKAVFLTHILGFNAMSEQLLDTLSKRNIPLIEDVCESHGATYRERKSGTFGLMSNFSFYYAHHMSTIEGGMICTNDEELYQMLRMLRSHGMVRESTSKALKTHYGEQYPDLNPDFIFAMPAYNVRNTELNAVLGRSQLSRLDERNAIRTENLLTFLEYLDEHKYQTDFAVEGSCSYALVLILKHPDVKLRNLVEKVLRSYGVEFRRGTSGGGNQLRQPYLRGRFPENEFLKFPNVEHIHFFGFYIGNYPELNKKKIVKLCSILNELS